MIPSLRLITITFCCGFLMVFASLRLAASVNGLHQAMPVMAAHAAPVTVGAIADRDLRRGQSAVPVMYDMRFAVGNAVPAAAGAQPVIDRAPSVMMPLVILPPIAREAERSTAREADAPVVAALAPQPATKPEPRVVIDIPLPEPAQVDLTFSPPASPKDTVAAASPATPQAAQRTIDIPLPDPAPVDLTLPPARPEAEAEQSKRPETDASSKSSAADAPIVLAALPADIPPGTVKLPTKRIPLPRARATTANVPPALAAKVVQAKPRRKSARTSQGNDLDSIFGFAPGGALQ